MLLKIKYPELAIEFDSKKNIGINLSELTIGSSRKVWWLCRNKHSWAAVVQSRTRNGVIHTCPYCKGIRPSKERNFATENKSLLKYWDYKKNTLKPEEFTPKSNKKIWWICSEGHSWQNSIKRTVLQEGCCPICKKRKTVSVIYNLKDKYPEIAKYWDYDKNTKTPDNYTPYSGKKVWWKCENHHSYSQPIVSKTRSGYGCPKCKIKGSRNEIRLYCELVSLGLDVKLRHKIKSIEFDIYLPDLKIAIEYDGAYYHKRRKKQDLTKNHFASNNSIFLHRVREYPLVKLSPNDLVVPNELLTKEVVDEIFESILTDKISNIVLQNYLKVRHFENENLYLNELKYLILPKDEESIINTHSYLEKEWDFKKNYPLTPNQFSPGSEQKIWWKCEYGHSWLCAIDKRTGSKRDAPQSCRICNNSIAHSDYNLQTEIYGIDNLWDFDKNDLKPTDYLPTSNKSVYWKCSFGHEFKASIVSRINRKTNEVRECIYCNGSVASSENNLFKFCSDVINHWDYDKNKDLTPDLVLPSSNKKVWWKCKTGHSFQQRIIDKINPKNGKVRTCRKCAENRWTEENNLGKVFPFLLEEWDYNLNSINPYYITPYSSKQVYWKCKNGHSFQRAPYQRVRRNSKKMVQCPKCRGLSK